ncbi:MAG: PKD domain-containing protein [Thermoplasmata archaeon]|nr:PKD domain-containing protein [Thermoplasmata archaeon]
MMRKIIAVVMAVGFITGFGVVNVHADGTPQADFHWVPSSPSTKDIVHFYDDSTNQSNITTRTWYFGDGYGSIEKNPSHEYAHPGTYTVRLVVIWNIGGTEYADEVQKNITIANQPPVADAGEDRVVNTRTVEFNGSGSYDPDGNITAWHWNFGDGTTASGEVVTHTYSADGEYTVTLNVTDDSGGWDTDTCAVVVDTSSPVTNVTLNGTAGKNGWYVSNVTVTLNASDPTSGVEKTYYRVDKGNWSEYSHSFVVSGEGTHIVEFYSVDDAGNNEGIKNVTVKIDKSAPWLTVNVPKDKRVYIFGRDILPARKTLIIGRITISASISDNVSGTGNMKIFVNGEERANITQPPYEWTWGGEIGLRTLKITAYDIAGLSSSKEIEVRIISLFKARNISPEAQNI